MRRVRGAAFLATAFAAGLAWAGPLRAQPHPDAWDELPWLTRRHPRVAVEVLASKGVMTGPAVDRLRERVESLEEATWIGLLVSGVLVLAILLGSLGS